MDNILGRQLEGRYLIEELVGVGGMANVYKAYDSQENRAVAVKMLRDEYAGDEAFLRRFRNETKAIYSLNHPNIIKIYDVVLAVENPFIVMEYIDGITLKDYIEKKGALNSRVAVHLISQVLTALAHAHDNGIVHSDIKPQNIMLLQDGTIKVMDFGIARFAMGQSRSLSDGSVVGSVHYLSPEQAAGDAQLDNRTDIYSTGVIFFEMLTGSLPFDDDNPISVAIKQMQQTPRHPRELRDDIPEALDEITMRAMQKNPDDRYQSAGDMLDDLSAFTRDPAITFGYFAAGGRAKKPRASAAKRGRDAKPKKKPSPLTVLFGVTVAFVLGSLIFVGVMFLIFQPFAKVPDMEMPDLIGIQYEQALSSDRYKELKIVLESQEFNSSFAVGEIFEQSPKAGKTVKQGSRVIVKVSNGAQTVLLPSFVGQEATGVYTKIIQLGLYYNTVEVNSDTILEGFVVKCEPGVNETVNAGSTVTVYVSRGSGKEMVLVPDVSGHDIEEAKTMLATSGLQAAITYTANSRLPDDTVISQTPVGNTQVPIGTAITLSVASDTQTTKTVTVKFVPPDIEDEISLSAMQDGATVFTQTIIPAAERIVSITFDGDGQSFVDIYFGGELYGSLTVDFDAGRYEWVVDNSGEF